jgi:signal transduction histidine kinase
MFSDIHQAGQRMLGLVNELLDLSKVDRSSLQLEREPCGPLALLSAAAAELAPLSQAKELPLQLASTAGATVPVDPARMAQVLRNLLANAIRFAPAGTAIELAAADGPGPDGRDGVTLTVADRGPGIPPAELESLFEPFVQSSLTKDGSGGTGLGLAIARRIVQAHGGTLHAANRAGGGAAFVLWLPAARVGASTTVTA